MHGIVALTVPFFFLVPKFKQIISQWHGIAPRPLASLSIPFTVLMKIRGKPLYQRGKLSYLIFQNYF